jgi:tRNA(adenine34) deaminase
VRFSPQDDVWMTRALRLARAAGARGEVPIGAVVVRGGAVLGAAGNRSVRAHDPTAHAEIGALRRAARRIGNYRLTGAVLYVSLEPCLMCFGAMVHARLGAVVYGAADLKVGVLSTLFRHGVPKGLNHALEARGGLRAAESTALLRDFFRERRGAVRPGAGRALALRATALR